MKWESDRVIAENFINKLIPRRSLSTPKAYVPELIWLWYNVDTQKTFATQWCALYSYLHIKISDGVVTDLYKRRRTKGQFYVETFNVNNGKLFERYFKVDAYTQLKLDLNDCVLQKNVTFGPIGFYGLPDDYKNDLANFPHKELICGYGTKPYGRIIGVWADMFVKRKYEAAWSFPPLDEIKYNFYYNKHTNHFMMHA